MNVALYWLPKKQRIDVEVTLSRRNLRVLLLSLGDEDTPSTFAREVEPGVRLVVHTVADDVHYPARNPGPVPPWTEAALQADLDGEPPDSDSR